MIFQINPEHFPDLPDALCRDYPGDIFYPATGESLALAKGICNLCPEKNACLEWALTHEETAGVWGGTSGDERRQIFRKKRKQGRAA